MFKSYANEDSPTTKQFWKGLSDVDRFNLIDGVIKNNTIFSVITLSETNSNGQVFIELNKAVPANERGTLLLDFEKILNENIDEGLNVWCEPIGDKSSLRNLRGIEIKS